MEICATCKSLLRISLLLQVLGFEVDNINSVQFSNHTGYSGGFKGQVLNENQLAEVFSGLEDNDLLPLYTHLLTGYVGNPAFLREIANIVKKLRSANPALVYGKFVICLFLITLQQSYLSAKCIFSV